MKLPRRAIASLLAVVPIPSVAASQEKRPEADEIVVRLPAEFFRRPHLKVTRSDPSGAVQFIFDPESPIRQNPFGGDLAFPGDGHGLMIVYPADKPEQPRFLRAEIKEITEIDRAGWTFTARLSPSVASGLHAGDRALFFRPPCTTSQLRALPEVILPPAAANDSASRKQSVDALKLIGLAMHNFESGIGHLPPAAVRGPDGRPWHSWRVLVLPYMDEGAIYNQYRFDEPWDGPNNRKLLDRMPGVFRDPTLPDDRGHLTRYAALVGDNTAFPASGSTQYGAFLIDRTGKVPYKQVGKPGATSTRDMPDGPSSTLLVAMVAADRKIPWTKPDDLAIGPKIPSIGQPGGISALYPARDQSSGRRVAPVLFADWSVQFIQDSIKPKDIASLMTRAGSEVIDLATLPIERVPPISPVVTLRIRRQGGEARASID